MAYLLVFRGELEPGITEVQAAAIIGGKLGKSTDFIESKLFIGKPVKVRSVESKREAKRYVEIFREAGAILEIVAQDKGSGGSGSGSKSSGSSAGGGSSPRGSRLKIGLSVAAALVLLLAGGAAWYTMPVWLNGSVSEAQARVSNALATRDVVGMAHFDIGRGADLHSRLFGAPDPGALLSADDAWDSLKSAGIDPMTQVDDVVVAFYADTVTMSTEPYWAAAITGDLDADRIRTWADSRFQVDRYDSDSKTLYFSWLDESTCELVAPHALRFGDGYALFTEADNIDALWRRIDGPATAEIGVQDWLDLSEQQLVTVGIFNPMGLAEAAGGMAGMMLAGAGQASQLAEAIYFGIAPTITPPGVIVQAAVTSVDNNFLNMAHMAGTTWLEQAKGQLSESPEARELVDRIFFSLDATRLTAGIRLDTDIEQEIETLVGGFMGGGMGSGMDMGPVDDMIDEEPFAFRNATAASLPAFEQFGEPYVTPQWRDGPFVLGVSGLSVDDNGKLQIALRGEARGLPNLGKRAKLVRIRVNDVVDSTGKSLLPELACGPQSAREWNESSSPTLGSHYVDDQIVKYNAVTFDKNFVLTDEADPGTVAAVRGAIEFQLPAEVRSIRLEMPVEDEVIEADGLRIAFQAGTPHSIDYKLSGDRSKLLDVRALNAAGAVLHSGSSSTASSWFGSGDSVSIDVQGTISTVEVIVADRLEMMSYDFELPSAYPAIDTKWASPMLPFEAAGAPELASAMRMAAPAPTFDWDEPLATADAGPAFLAVRRIDSGFMGLSSRMALFVPVDMPILNHLNGSSLLIEQATLADGTTVPLAMNSTGSLGHSGGYWRDEEFVPDSDKPWLTGEFDLRDEDFDLGEPVQIEGRVILRAPVSTVDSTMSAAPGSTLSEGGVELVVSEWQSQAIEVDIGSGAEGILSIEALDADGNQVGRVDTITEFAGTQTARVSNLVAQPSTLRVLLAEESAEHEVPFSISLGGESTAGPDF